MRPDGTCPTCGRPLEVRQPLPTAAAEAADEDTVGAKAPWHFKVLLVALVVYLTCRGVQGVDLIARHL